MDRSVRRESSTVVPHALHGHEVKDGRRLGGRLELAQTTMLGHFDEYGSLASRRRMGGANGNDLPAQEFVPVAVLLDLRRLQHEVDDAIRALDDEERSPPGLIFGSADHTPADLDARDELSEELRCIGVDEGLAVARHALLEVAGELHLFEGREEGACLMSEDRQVELRPKAIRRSAGPGGRESDELDDAASSRRAHVRRRGKRRPLVRRVLSGTVERRSRRCTVSPSSVMGGMRLAEVPGPPEGG